MKNNKISHLYTYVFLLMLSFFLFSFNVNADTYNLTFNSSDFDILQNSSYLNIYNNANTYCQQNNCTFMIMYSPSANQYIVSSLFSGSSSISVNNWGSGIIWSNPSGSSWRNCMYDGSGNTIYACSNGSTSWTTPGFRISSNTIIEYLFVFSNIPPSAFTLTAYNSNNTYNLSYNSFSTTIDSSNFYIPSLYEIYNYVPPPPPDNIPILTDFYTLIIDKFSVIADFFTDNTYLFAIPLIPILILCIYLIKRSLIK